MFSFRNISDRLANASQNVRSFVARKCDDLYGEAKQFGTMASQIPSDFMKMAKAYPYSAAFSLTSATCCATYGLFERCDTTKDFFNATSCALNPVNYWAGSFIANGLYTIGLITWGYGAKYALSAAHKYTLEAPIVGPALAGVENFTCRTTSNICWGISHPLEVSAKILKNVVECAQNNPRKMAAAATYNLLNILLLCARDEEPCQKHAIVPFLLGSQLLVYQTLNLGEKLINSEFGEKNIKPLFFSLCSKNKTRREQEVKSIPLLEEQRERRNHLCI